jgi:hypothetical protein
MEAEGVDKRELSVGYLEAARPAIPRRVPLRHPLAPYSYAFRKDEDGNFSKTPGK